MNFAERVRDAIRELYDKYNLAGSLEQPRSELGDVVARVERFQRRYREQFRGPESLDFEGTLRLIDRFEKLCELEKALREMDLDALDDDALGALLGQQFGNAVARLRQMMRALVEAGYVVTKGGRQVLTPKAARRMGRLALREMLAELLPDGAGHHDSPRCGVRETVTEQARADGVRRADDHRRRGHAQGGPRARRHGRWSRTGGAKGERAPRAG